MKNFIFELMSYRRKMTKKAVAISIWVVVQFWQTTRQFELLYEYLFQMLIYTVVVLDVLASQYFGSAVRGDSVVKSAWFKFYCIIILIS